MKRLKNRKMLFFLFVMPLPLLFYQPVLALEDNKIIKVLSKNPELFHENGMINSAIRFIGWGITKGIAAVADVCATLYDTCFGFIDFTSYKPVRDFINEWKVVFIALVCLSLLFIGILLCVGWDKKPKIVINLLLAVTVVSASSYLINTMNGFIATEVREDVLDGESSSAVYNTIGSNIHDLVWLDETVGLKNLTKKKNAKKVYSSFKKSQFKNLDINEILDPDDFDGDTADILTYGLTDSSDSDGNTTYKLEELYDGVAWTDMLNEFYYRYTVDYGVLWMELAAYILVYLFMSYKVVRSLYEIAFHRLIAYLYSANLNNNQKILKILDSIKDSYILLLMTSVLIKFYLLATKFISSWEIGGISKGIILIFLAFAVIDGPNIFQRLTGMDVGASNELGKLTTLYYGGRMAAGAAKAGAGAVKGAAGATKNGAQKLAGFFSKGKDVAEEAGGEEAMEAAGGVASADNILNGDNGNENHNTSARQEQNSFSQNNQENSQADIRNEGKEPGEPAGTAGGNPSGQSGKEADSSSARASSFDRGNANGSMSGHETGKNGLAGSERQGKHSMDSIGRVPSRADTLNGNGTGNSYRDAGNSMKRMEQDINKGQGDFPDSYGSTGGTPIDVGGKMFGKWQDSHVSSSMPDGKPVKAKDVFDGKER